MGVAVGNHREWLARRREVVVVDARDRGANRDGEGRLDLLRRHLVQDHGAQITLHLGRAVERSELLLLEHRAKLRLGWRPGAGRRLGDQLGERGANVDDYLTTQRVLGLDRLKSSRALRNIHRRHLLDANLLRHGCKLLLSQTLGNRLGLRSTHGHFCSNAKNSKKVLVVLIFLLLFETLHYICSYI